MKQVMNYHKDNGLLNMMKNRPHDLQPNGPVEVNKGNTIINGTNGVTINDSFEVKNGASLEIRTN